MALVLDDRVKETSTTTGTGTLNLSGAVSGFQTFVAGVGDGNTTYYAIVNRDADEWEVGLGTVTDSSTDTLSRSAITSSNSDSAVNFSAGTKDVFVTLPASKVASLDTNNNLTIGSGTNGVDYTLTFDGHAGDGVLTWMEDEDYFKFSDDILINSTEKLQFQDTGTYIYSNADGDLDVVSDGTAVDSINLESAGGITLDAGTAGSGIVYEDDGTEMARLYNSSSDVILETKVSDKDFSIKGNDGGSAITALSLDMSAAGAATFNDKVIATELDISGNMDIDGTSNLDAVDIDGAVQIDNTVTVGVDDTGYDVKFFGDTASAYMLWDTSADDLILGGAAGLIVPDGQFTLGSTAVSSTAAEINLIDGGTARGTTAVASGDGILINDGGTMRMTNVDTVSTYFASHSVGGGNIVTTGALNSGSITSGFGTINTGSSAITTTGLISGGSLDIDDVLINGTTIGHTDDTDLMTVADGLLTVAGEISVTTLDIGGTNVTSTAAELNILDGVTATATEINLIDGVTATTAELNYNDIATLGTTAASKTFTADANNLTKITGGVYLEEANLTFDATQDWDVRASPIAKVTLTNNVTFDAPTNPTTGQYISIVCIQDGTGSRTIAWNAVFEFKDDTAPTATTTASKGDMFTFRYNGSKWLEVGRNLNLTLS